MRAACTLFCYCLLICTGVSMRYRSFSLAQKPGLTLGIVFLVSLGVGTSTAIFAIMRPVLLRPLPYPQPQQIVAVWETRPTAARLQLSLADLQDTERRGRNFAFLAAYRESNVTVSGWGSSDLSASVKASLDFFKVLGIHPLLGRDFNADDFSSRKRVVLISAAMWRNRFKSEADLSNRPVVINGEIYSIIGVIPEALAFPSDTQLWMPLFFDNSDLSSRGNRNLLVIARLQPNVELWQAQREVAAISASLAQEHPDTNSKTAIFLVLLQKELNGAYSATLWSLFGAASLIVLICCANIAGLLLANGISRMRTVMIKKALGATNARIVREQLAESLLTALIGGSLGLFLARLCIVALPKIVHDMPYMGQIHLNMVEIGFACLVVVLCVLLFGTMPAIALSGVKFSLSVLNLGNVFGSRKIRRFQMGLIVFETALTLVILISAGLLMQTVRKFWVTPIGFNPTNVLTMNFILPQSRYAQEARKMEFFKVAIDKVQALPGVVNTAVIYPSLWRGKVRATFRSMVNSDSQVKHDADLVICSDKLFDLLEIPLLRGRLFNPTDDHSAPPVVVINQALAAAHFNSGDPLGAVIDIEGFGKRMIIGMVGNIRQFGFKVPPEPTIFIPYIQSLPPWAGLIVRTSAAKAEAAKNIRREIDKIDPDVPTAFIQTLEETLSESIEQQAFMMMLLMIFAVIALSLSLAGIYAFASRMVESRKQEFAIRIAMGASSATLLKLIYRNCLFLIITGIMIGLVVSAEITKVLSNLLWNVKPLDELTISGSVLFLLVANVLALLWPATRVLSTPPATILHQD